MTPLDSLASILRTRLTYHAERLSAPGEDPMFHTGAIYGVIQALSALHRVQRGERADD